MPAGNSAVLPGAQAISGSPLEVDVVVSAIGFDRRPVLRLECLLPGHAKVRTEVPDVPAPELQKPVAHPRRDPLQHTARIGQWGLTTARRGRDTAEKDPEWEGQIIRLLVVQEDLLIRWMVR